MIREKNDHATIITTPWDEIDGAAIREAMQNYKSLEETMMDEAKKGHDHDHDHGDECTCGCHDHDHHHDHEHHHDHDEHEHHHDHDEHEHHHDHDDHDHHHDHDHGDECTCGCHDHDHHHHHADEVFTSWGKETSTMRTSSERSLTLWLTQRSTVLSSEQRVSFLAMQVSGCTLILYQASSRSERARLTSLVSFA